MPQNKSYDMKFANRVEARQARSELKEFLCLNAQVVQKTINQNL